MGKHAKGPGGSMRKREKPRHLKDPTIQQYRKERGKVEKRVTKKIERGRVTKVAKGETNWLKVVFVFVLICTIAAIYYLVQVAPVEVTKHEHPVNE